MSILVEIHSWSKTLPAWQQDAVARLYANRRLEDADFDDLYALATQEAGIADPKGRQAKKLQDAQVASPPVPTRLVRLTGIKALSNLNALADGALLPIAPAGLTAIYGENGAGKSGYSRALKHACRARDQREPILPNANRDAGKAAPTRAVFGVTVDGAAADLAWQYKLEPPEPLSEIAIFDTHCARAYIDNEGDFSYAPYGLDILAGLVATCNKLKERAAREKAQNTPNDFAFASLAREQTAVGKALSRIGKGTSAAEIEALAAMTQIEIERLESLATALAEADPKQKAQALRQKAARLAGLALRIAAASILAGSVKVAELEALVKASNAAKKAAEIASANFRQTSGQLPGTGGEEWRALFDAARAFAAVSHEGHPFPFLPEASACPLCQSPLGSDGAKRLARFDDFIQQAVEKTARDARAKAATAYKALEQAQLDLAIDEALCQELAEIDVNLAAACTAMHDG